MKRSSGSGIPFIHTGISLLLVVFVIVVLVTFSAAILTTADNDLSLSEKSARNRTDYYTASNTAEKVLSEIDAILEECYLAEDSETDYYKECRSRLSSVSPENTALSFSDDNTVSFSIPVSDDRALDIGIMIQYPEAGDAYYHIIQWKCCSTKDWSGNDTVEVYIP